MEFFHRLGFEDPRRRAVTTGVGRAAPSAAWRGAVWPGCCLAGVLGVLPGRGAAWLRCST
jgi:hypothetical protein